MKFLMKAVLFFLNFHLYDIFSPIQAKVVNSIINIPDGLLFGAGTSAFQVEGALKSHGRGESFVEASLLQALNIPKSTADLAEITSDSYHRFKKDVEVLKYIGLDIYRFSMSWSRLLPSGNANQVNQEGVDYYHALLDELKRAGVEPMVQLHHFDHPAILDKYGGWQNETMIELFKDYARFVFQEFGHKIKYFLTFNEPNVLCNMLESGVLQQLTGTKSTSKEPAFPKTYICSHNILKAHAEVYHLYHDEFNLNRTGQISINLLCNDYMIQKANYQNLEDVAFAFGCGWFADPIFSESGDYSDILKERVKETNSLRGYDDLQMPTFSDEWIKKIRGSADFFGLSYYSTRIVEDIPSGDLESSLNFFLPSEARLDLTPVTTWLPTPNQNFIVPAGLRTILKKIKKRYNNPDLHILENGYSDDGQLDDTNRIAFIYSHVKQVVDAMNLNECSIKSYIYWSLIDNFEFWAGYSSHFGLAHIDFDSPNRTRTLKKSATWFRNVILKRKLYIEE